MTAKNGYGNGARRGQVVSGDEGLPGGYDPDYDTGYNPADFIIPGRDHQGHSERIYCSVQPQTARALNVIFKSKKFPFRTEGDLFRWAITRSIGVLERLDPTPGFMGVANAITEVIRQDMYLQEFTSMFTTMEKVINQHVAAGDYKAARKLIGAVLAQVRSIDEGGWREKCEQAIGVRFGHLLEGTQGRLGKGNRAAMGQGQE